jgi:putative serine protease PepD
MIAVLSLLLGIGGGVLGALLVTGSGGDGSGGVLRVEKRTAAPLPADNKSIAAVADRVLPSTVQIIAEFDGDPRGATGSGFVLDKQGHVITNNHVVDEAAKDDGNIEIVDRNGKHSKASVVGRSLVYDIAVLKSEGVKGMTPAKLGSSEQMRVGETVVAIGSPLGLSSSVTSGIISALDRPVTTGESQDDTSYINAVQTDAAINPGNSGGPLVNLRGQVVGVNSAIATTGDSLTGESGSIGVGFAIPMEQVQITAAQILRTGEARYPVIGANVNTGADTRGAEVVKVPSGTPAARAGLHEGDVVVKVNGKPVTDGIGLIVAIRSHRPGETVTLTVSRNGRTKRIKVTLDGKVG